MKYLFARSKNNSLRSKTFAKIFWTSAQLISCQILDKWVQIRLRWNLKNSDYAEYITDQKTFARGQNLASSSELPKQRRFGNSRRRQFLIYLLSSREEELDHCTWKNIIRRKVYNNGVHNPRDKWVKWSTWRVYRNSRKPLRRRQWLTGLLQNKMHIWKRGDLRISRW